MYQSKLLLFQFFDIIKMYDYSKNNTNKFSNLKPYIL